MKNGRNCTNRAHTLPASEQNINGGTLRQVSCLSWESTNKIEIVPLNKKKNMFGYTQHQIYIQLVDWSYMFY